jgi:hypothetical protein
MAEEKKPTLIEFWTIDRWNRPVFRAENGNLYGSLDKLFSHGTTEGEVLEEVSETDITFFGRDIDDDPMGTSTNVTIKNKVGSVPGPVTECPECSSKNWMEVDCDACGATGFDPSDLYGESKCQQCAGTGYEPAFYECTECSHRWYS